MLIDAAAIVEVNDAHLQRSDWARENVTLGNKAIDVLNAATRLDLDEPEDIAVLRLAIRLINAAGAGGALALCGYYQQAAGQIRDLIEVGFLLDLFSRSPKELHRWRVCGTKARKANFSAFEVRKILKKLDGGPAVWDRDAAYELYSGHGTHMDPDRVVLFSPDMMSMIGPFPDEKRVLAISFDLARYTAAGARFLIAWVRTRSPSPGPEMNAYMQAVIEFDFELRAFNGRSDVGVT